MPRRLATYVVTHARAVVIVSYVVAFVGVGIGGPVVASLSSSVAAPDAPSLLANQILADAAGVDVDSDVVALVTVPRRPITSAAGASAVAGVVARLRAIKGVATVQSPLAASRGAAGGGAPRIRSRSQLVSRDRESAVVIGEYSVHADQANVSSAILTAFAHDHEVLLGGDAITTQNLNTTITTDLTVATLLAFPLLMLVGLWVFRSGVATLVPLIASVFTICAALFGLWVANHFYNLSEYVIDIVIGLGLGLAIDYSLFIISRYREEATELGYTHEALVRALGSAGRTVAFSALTVTAALASLLIFPERFLFSMGVGSVLTVTLAAFSALVVLPAILALLGPRVERLASPRWQRRTKLAAAYPTANGWYWLSRRVMRRPGLWLIVVLAIVGVCLYPALHTRLSNVDARALPVSSPSHEVYTALSERFDLDPGRQMLVAWVGPGGRPAAAAVSSEIGSLPGVKAVSGPARLNPHTWMITVITKAGPYTGQSTGLVTRIRDLPAAELHGGRVYPSGDAAGFLDMRSSLLSRVPLVLGLVGLVVFLIVLVMTESVVLALKTIVINALNVAAVIGILVWVFQDGHLQGLLNFQSIGAIDITQPVLVIMLAFALSTDYGVFLLSRIKEEHDGGASTSDAVAYGLGRVGRIVTYAAVLLCIALGSFSTSHVLIIKQLGLGCAFAVILDATLIRGILVPAAMQLFGSANWWAPRPVKTLLGRLPGRRVNV